MLFASPIVQFTLAGIVNGISSRNQLPRGIKEDRSDRHWPIVTRAISPASSVPQQVLSRRARGFDDVLDAMSFNLSSNQSTFHRT
eukprot:3585494-Karenia_brevis.AAC.1